MKKQSYQSFINSTWHPGYHLAHKHLNVSH